MEESSSPPTCQHVLPKLLGEQRQDAALNDFRDEDAQQVLHKGAGHGHVVALELGCQVLHIKQGLLRLPPPIALPATSIEQGRQAAWGGASYKLSIHVMLTGCPAHLSYWKTKRTNTSAFTSPCPMLHVGEQQTDTNSPPSALSLLCCRSSLTGCPPADLLVVVTAKSAPQVWALGATLPSQLKVVHTPRHKHALLGGPSWQPLRLHSQRLPSQAAGSRQQARKLYTQQAPGWQIACTGSLCP